MQTKQVTVSKVGLFCPNFIHTVAISCGWSQLGRMTCAAALAAHEVRAHSVGSLPSLVFDLVPLAEVALLVAGLLLVG